MKYILLVAGIFLGQAAFAAADAVVITDSGSTNAAGFRIDVDQSGDGVYTPKPRRPSQLTDEQQQPRKRRISADLIKRFYADLDAAKPFSGLPNQGCMKSASFGTTLVLEYLSEKTPDLSCGDRGSAKLKSLIQSTNAIIKVFDNP